MDRVGAGTARAALPTQQAAVAVVQSEGDQGKAGERAAGVGERAPWLPSANSQSRQAPRGSPACCRGRAAPPYLRKRLAGGSISAPETCAVTRNMAIAQW